MMPTEPPMSDEEALREMREWAKGNGCRAIRVTLHINTWKAFVSIWSESYGVGRGRSKPTIAEAWMALTKQDGFPR